ARPRRHGWSRLRGVKVDVMGDQGRTEAAERGARRGLGAAVACALALGCAHKPPPPPPAPPPLQVTVERSVRLAWLPVDGASFPGVASAGNARLEGARVPGVDFRFKVPVSMEVAQLSIECIELSPTCYERVGRRLDANRLLWVVLVPVHQPGSSEI